MSTESKSSFSGIDFTTGAMMPKLARYFTPFLLSFLLNSLYNTVDTIIIGQFVGSSGIVAVSMGGKMLNLFTLVGTAFASGGQILIAQFSGAKRNKDIQETIGTLFSGLLVISVVIAAILVIFSRELLSLLNTPAESMNDARAYLVITSLGMPFIFGYNAVSAILRGKGDSKGPLKFIAIAAVFNVIGDLVFILVFKMGAAGTAIATIMGQAVSLAFSVAALYKNRENFNFDFKIQSFRIVKGKLAAITKLAIPLTLRTFFIHVTIMYISSLINQLGLAEAAAYSVGEKITSLANIFVYAANQSMAGITGQNYGAGKPERIGQAIKCALAITLTTAVLVSVVGLIWPKAFFSCFTSDEAVMAYAQSFIIYTIPAFIIAALQDPFDGFVTGVGNTVYSLIGGLLDGVVLRLSFSFLFAYGLNMGLNGFFLANGLSRLGPMTVDMLVYFKSNWRSRAGKLIN